MGRSSNRHRNTVNSGSPREVYVPDRVSDGVRHPVRVSHVGQLEVEPVHTSDGHVWLDSDGAVVGDQEGQYA